MPVLTPVHRCPDTHTQLAYLTVPLLEPPPAAWPTSAPWIRPRPWIWQSQSWVAYSQSCQVRCRPSGWPQRERRRMAIDANALLQPQAPRRQHPRRPRQGQQKQEQQHPQLPQQLQLSCARSAAPEQPAASAQCLHQLPHPLVLPTTRPAPAPRLPQVDPAVRATFVSKVKICVARLTSVEPLPGSDKLLRTKADLGGGDERQVGPAAASLLGVQCLAAAARLRVVGPPGSAESASAHSCRGKIHCLADPGGPAAVRQAGGATGRPGVRGSQPEARKTGRWAAAMRGVCRGGRGSRGTTPAQGCQRAAGSRADHRALPALGGALQVNPVKQ
jgi:tRNA-binding EMAP/Myf-like protein